MRSQVWLIGGTSESADIARELLARGIPHVVTVTTAAAEALYLPSTQVQVGSLTPAAMEAFIHQHQVGCILDASHPFASEVSRQAIALIENQTKNQTRNTNKISYLRYERPTVLNGNDPKTDTQSNHPVTLVQSIEALLASDLLCHQRVLFTLGYRYLSQFTSLRQTSQLFARILPSTDAIAHTLSAGFTPQEIIALRPPVSAALEKALWQQWNISIVVAKASGSPGGEAIKRQVAASLGTRLVLIQRPEVTYPQQTNSIEEAVMFCQQALTIKTSDT